MKPDVKTFQSYRLDKSKKTKTLTAAQVTFDAKMEYLDAQIQQHGNDTTYFPTEESKMT